VKGKCALCNRTTELLESHIIPRFAFKWLKETAPTAIRNAKNPNMRVQDGVKEYLLCNECENLFNKWETKFYEEIFLPFHNNPNSTVRYSPWALKFAVSVSWRVLTYLYKHPTYLSDTQREAALNPLNSWQRFLIGELPNPGQFEQHLLRVGLIIDYKGLEK
jgi:hypothetical protein